MVSKITAGIKVSVETFYQLDYSNPMQSEFMFAYRITIENLTGHDMKLLSRHWFIFDSEIGNKREVKGEGVVGMTPVIESGKDFQYVSGVNLHSEMGTMNGCYTFQNQSTKDLVEVKVPKFELIVPFKHN
jgi:ApaG protein